MLRFNPQAQRLAQPQQRPRDLRDQIRSIRQAQTLPVWNLPLILSASSIPAVLRITLNPALFSKAKRRYICFVGTDVFLFADRLKYLARQYSESAAKTLWATCLRGEALL